MTLIDGATDVTLVLMVTSNDLGWLLKRWLWLPFKFRYQDARDAWLVLTGRASIEPSGWYKIEKQKRRRT